MKQKYQVGGVVYRLLQSVKDKVNEKIDIPKIKSIVHDPISVSEDVEIKGYVPQYTFKKSAEETPETKPEIATLSFDFKTPALTGNFHTMLYNAFTKAGVADNVAKFMVAQDSLETGDGKYHAGKYNYGNITAGSSWTGSVTESGDKDASGNKITQKFRNYDSVDQYAADKKALLSTSRYKCSMSANTIEEYARCVKAGGYAEDPEYEQKLIKKYYSLYGTNNA